MAASWNTFYTEFPPSRPSTKPSKRLSSFAEQQICKVYDDGCQWIPKQAKTWKGKK